MKTGAVFNTPGEFNVKLTTACFAIDSIESYGSCQWSHHSHVSGSTGGVGKFVQYHRNTSKY